jgi:hypothetical protein
MAFFHLRVFLRVWSLHARVSSPMSPAGFLCWFPQALCLLSHLSWPYHLIYFSWLITLRCLISLRTKPFSLNVVVSEIIPFPEWICVSFALMCQAHSWSLRHGIVAFINFVIDGFLIIFQTYVLARRERTLIQTYIYSAAFPSGPDA